MSTAGPPQGAQPPRGERREATLGGEHISPRDHQSGAEDVASPCTKVCTLDPATGLCRGCSRTLDEIAAWSTLDDAGKRAVLAAVAARRGSIEASRAP